MGNVRYLGNRCDPGGKIEARPLCRGDSVSWGIEIVDAGFRPGTRYPVLAVDMDALTLTTMDDAGQTAVVLMTSGMRIFAGEGR